MPKEFLADKHLKVPVENRRVEGEERLEALNFARRFPELVSESVLRLTSEIEIGEHRQHHGNLPDPDAPQEMPIRAF